MLVVGVPLALNTLVYAMFDRSKFQGYNDLDRPPLSGWGAGSFGAVDFSRLFEAPGEYLFSVVRTFMSVVINICSILLVLIDAVCLEVRRPTLVVFFRKPVLKPAGPWDTTARHETLGLEAKTINEMSSRFDKYGDGHLEPERNASLFSGKATMPSTAWQAQLEVQCAAFLLSQDIHSKIKSSTKVDFSRTIGGTKKVPNRDISTHCPVSLEFPLRVNLKRLLGGCHPFGRHKSRFTIPFYVAAIDSRFINSLAGSVAYKARVKRAFCIPADHRQGGSKGAAQT